MNATAKDLRFHTKKILESVITGEEVIITYHGKPCAKIIPLKTKSTANENKIKNPLRGIGKIISFVKMFLNI